jgi:hypothetical protein
MEKLNSFRSPMKELGNFNVVTSTPHLKSDIGKELVKRHFIKNFPRDLSVSMLEEKISKLTINLNIGNTPNQSPEFKPFVFKKIQDSSDQAYEFRTPKTISPETIEKYNKLFDNSPKFTRKRIRL